MELFEENDLYLNVLRKRRLNKLWNINEELHEVNIFQENKNVVEKNFDDILNLSGVQCHICNLEVPKMYIKEHNQTSIHQNLLKLTDEALERTRKHMRSGEMSNLTIKVENIYFCDTCSRIVQNSEKEIHENSIFHKQCEKFDNLLSCFVDSYLNIHEKKYDLNFDLENNCDFKNGTAEYVVLLSEVEQEELQKELYQNLECGEIQELLKTETEDLHSLKKSDSQKELTENQTQELIKSPKSSKKQKIEKIKSYIDLINSKYHDRNYEIEFISKNQIKITALNKDILLVPLQNFHSYNNKYCRVCLSEILEENHEMSEDHISRIMTPIADKNSIREVDDIWSHCIVCNDLTKTVASHNQSASHKKNLKKYYLIQFSRSQMVQIEKVQNQEGAQNTTEDAQNTTEDTQNTTEDAHKQAENPENTALKINIAPQFDEFFKKIETKIDSLFPIFKKVVENEHNSDDSDDFQIVSRKNKPNTPKKIADQEILNTIKETNKSEIINNDLDVQSNQFDINQDLLQNKPNYYCYVCRINVADFDAHKFKESHKRMGKETKKRNQDLKKVIVRNYILQDKNQNLLTTKCGLCHVTVTYDKGLIESHVNTDVHRKNYLKFMENNKIILIDDQECHCEPCDQRQSRNNVFNHCSSPQHVEKLKNHLNKENKIKNASQNNHPKKNDKKKFTNTTDISKLMYHFQDKNDNVFCKTCYVYIPKMDATIEAHIESAGHCNKYNGIMKQNKVQVYANSFYCEICSVKIPVGDEIDHVYSISHRDTLILKSKAKQNEPNKNNIQPLPSSSKSLIECVPKIQPKKTEPEQTKEIMVPLFMKHQFKRVNKTEGFCKVCEISLLNSKIIEHANSSKHKFTFGLLMFKNGIKIKEGHIYSCLTCGSTLTRFNEIDHVFGKPHIKNLQDKKLNDLESDLENLTFNYIASIPGSTRLVLF